MSPRDRRRAWSAAGSDAFVRQEVQPQASDFETELEIVELGRLRVVEVRSGPARVEHRSGLPPPADERCFLLRLQVEGCASYHQEGAAISLEPGDFMLCDAMRAYAIIFDRPGTILVMRIPERLARLYAPSIEYSLGVRIDGQSGYRRVISRLVRELMEAGRGTTAGLSDASGPILTLLDAALVEQGRPDGSGTGARTRRRIVEHIEQRMDDPELDPRSIARSIGISQRYLHRLFRTGAQSEESISRYVVRRRLERCRDILSDPGQASRTVTAIALSGGFNSVSYFTTLFARAYGAPPARFRAAALSGRGRPPPR